MSASMLPSLLVPIVGFVVPILTVSLFFKFIEKEYIE
uniref:Photosystem I reaction center subunit VIII n=1 Tax=Lepocinclis tripteris TaxID=135494 RepID=A0A3G3LL83_9EUGL|nr:photosystem I 4 kDa hydrophobic subunit [Lepocinclis tripteris]